MAAPRRILVTGASGFIGTHLCAALHGRGDEVRALYRRKVPPPELAALEGSRFELLNADLADVSRLAEACRDRDTVIHVAALAADWGPYEAFKAANYDATVNLLEAARAAGVSRFVFISSAVVSGFGPHVDSTEEGPYLPLRHHYQTTKKLAEEYVLGQDAPGFRTIALRPCNVYGAGDRMSTYQMFEAILGGVFGYIGDGSAYTCPLYIDDLVAGVVAAVDHVDLGGEALILTDGQKVPWREYVEAMFQAVGSTRRPTSLPIPLAFAAAHVMTFVARAVGARNPPPLTLYRVEQGARHYHFSGEKARRLLGFEPRVFYREGLALTAKAFLADRAAQRSSRHQG